ncbi:preprotein translocase subunit YajC [bacterium]|nr:MAG: preprotein translocase subunit YajC [bacterium]
MDLAFLTMLMAGPAAEGGKEPNLFMSLLPFIIIIAVFYFLFIRPQQKKQKEHDMMVTNLQKGEKVITSGGLIGTVVGVGDETITLRFGDNFKAEVGKSYIVGKTE